MASNLSRRAQRKRQTRLAFDPVDPDSSATMSPARIRYESSATSSGRFNVSSPAPAPNNELDEVFPSGKKYAVVIESPPSKKKDPKLPFKPVSASSPLRGSGTQLYSSKNNVTQYPDSDSDDDLLVLPSRKRRRLKINSKASSQPQTSSLYMGEDLSLLPAGASGFMGRTKRIGLQKNFGDARDASEKLEAATSPAAQEIPKSLRRSKDNDPILIESSDESSAETLTSSSPNSPFRANFQDGSAQVPSKITLKDSVSDKDRSAKGLVSGGGAYSNPILQTPTQDISNSEGQSAVSKPNARKSKSKSSSFAEKDGVALPVAQSTSALGARSNQRTRKQAFDSDEEDEDSGYAIRSSQRQQQATTIMSDEDESDGELQEVSKIPISSQKQTTAPTFQKRDFDSSEEDEEDEPILSSPKKRRRPALTEDEEDESDVVGSPAKRLRFSSKTSSKEKSIGKSADEKAPQRQTRQVQGKKPRTEREKNLELLRRKRNGEKITELTPSGSEEDEPRRGLYDSDSELEVLNEFEDEEIDEEEEQRELEMEQVRQSIRATNRNEYDDDFVVEDDDAPLGVPDYGLNSIPLEFTRHANKPLKEHFKDAVEWMVQRKINPRFAQNDPIYIRAFQKVDDEVHGLASSKFSSSSWNLEFKRAVWARPIYAEEQLKGGSLEGRGCDACGRMNHPATFEISLTGTTYYKATLDPVNDHDEDSEGDDVSVNSDGQELPKQDVTWAVGKVCRRNAEMTHMLLHWRYGLNEWVIDRLESDGHLTPEKLAERLSWAPKKLGKYANKVVDGWEANKVIKRLWQDFKTQLDIAREEKPGRFS